MSDLPRDGIIRRQFLKAAGLLGTGMAMGTHPRAEARSDASTGRSNEKHPSKNNADQGSSDIPLRTLGRAGVKVSALGLGGHHLGDVENIEEAIRLVHEAVDSGITFFDNCWEYHNGKSEDWMGRALKGRRDKVFLMTCLR